MTSHDDTIHAQVRAHFAEAADAAASGDSARCTPDNAPWGTEHYDTLDDLPEEATLASLGCGNPTAVADLRPGDVVLDLGSGGGIDCCCPHAGSARPVTSTGST